MFVVFIFEWLCPAAIYLAILEVGPGGVSGEDFPEHHSTELKRRGSFKNEEGGIGNAGISHQEIRSWRPTIRKSLVTTERTCYSRG